ncbi:MAG: amino acid ABC transporter permease [Firmicutes bacterium]|nr:amino acid ABC transporter permease [Bacillota bacterium]
MFGDAVKMTLYLATLGILIGLVLGLVFGLMKLSKNPILRFITGVYIGFVRGTPLLVQLMLMYWVVGAYVNLSAPLLASIGLGIHNGAYLAEIFRGAIQSIARGQMEAARSLGMTHYQAMRRIILPQALKRAIPPMGNQFIIAVKDSSLAFSISVMEIMGQTRVFFGSNYQPFPMLAIASVYYLILTTGLSVIVNMIERYLSKGEVRA